MPRAAAILVASNTSIARITPPVPGASGSTCRCTSMAPTSAGSVRPRSTGPRTGSTFQSSSCVCCARLGPTANPNVHRTAAKTIIDGRDFTFLITTSLTMFVWLRFQLTQFVALDLPRRSAWQIGADVDPAWIFPQAGAFLHVRLERLHQRIARAVAVAQHDERLWLDQPVGILLADHGCFQHCLVRGERGLDLERRHPHAAHLEHVIGAAAIVIVAVAVTQIFVAGVGPFAREGVAALVALVPVAFAGRGPAHHKLADLAVGQHAAVLVDDLDLVAGNRLASRAVADVV